MRSTLERLWLGCTAARLPLRWRARRPFSDIKSDKPELSQSASRIARIEARLPRFLARFVAPLRTAPISHITAFLVLHEITALAPVIGLAAAFHYNNWLPPYISEGRWVSEGIEKFGTYMRKKGWIEDETRTGRWWGRGEKGSRLLVEVATAYAITKALLPLRLAASIWMTPWFARWTILPITGRFARMWSRKKGNPARTSGAAGTGATSGSAIPKD